MGEYNTKQLDFWKSDFGVQYTDRNDYSPETRVKAFREMLTGLEISKILEVGCNRGCNLISLSKLGNYRLIGVEPNTYAVEKARVASSHIAILEESGFNLPFKDSYFDVVFTAGVLIHIAAVDLPVIINEMYRTSGKYLLVVEYFAETETPITYRGNNDVLFKRNFKKLFLEQKPDLKCIREGFWGKDNGFDDCTWWLFEKPSSK
jgi:pseudaminic acid biosynthesis-associated methylase